jgi:hypothetical protein
MTQTFNRAAVLALFEALEDQALALGDFARVNRHEPKSAPGRDLSCSIWVDNIAPVKSSGLSAVSGRVTFTARVYNPMLSEPQDDIDPAILAATCDLMAAYSGGFTLDGTVRDIDLLGADGPALAAQAGYIQQDNRLFRTMDTTIPIVINDMWLEVP